MPTVDEIAAEIDREVRIEMRARDRVADAGDSITEGTELHTIKSLLDEIDQLRAALKEQSTDITPTGE